LGLIAVFTLAFLYWQLNQAETGRQAIGLGYAFGLGLMGFGVSWIHHSIVQFGGISQIAAIAITALFVAVVSLYFALFSGVYHTLNRYLSTRAALLGLAPMVWAVSKRYAVGCLPASPG